MPSILFSAVLCLIIGGSVMAVENPIASRADLPPLLEFANGKPVKTKADWAKRQAEIRELMCRYFIGTFPFETPKLLKSEVLSATLDDSGSKRRVRLTFDTPNKVAFEMEVWVPSGNGPYPVLLTAPRYYQMGWAKTAFKRGYLVCLYPGVDSHHQEADYPGFESKWTEFRSEYPEATWTEIAVKAWIASRALDYLLSPDSGYKIAKDQIGIIGHSRYGKQSLIATAFDPRITCVVARSPGTPASCSYRFAARYGFNEASEDFPDEWFLASLRSYTGRENELPIDVNGWFGLIAPRRCMIHTGYNDDSDPTYGVEQTYNDAKKAYKFLGHEDNIRVIYRPGGHNDPDGIVDQESQDQNIDWFDLAFNQGTVTKAQFPERLLHKFDWNNWKSHLSKSDLTVPSGFNKEPKEATDKRNRILWFLGQAANGATKWTGTGEYFTDQESFDSNHDVGQLPNVVKVPVVFGSGIKGNVYYNSAVKTPMPVVIWLHPYSYGTGYGEGYGVQGASLYHRLAARGYLVLAYDQVGFGSRLLEGTSFYTDFPKWSRMGRMVADVSSATDFITAGQGKAKSTLPEIKQNQIYLLGYSLGGTVALYAAALDNRIAGVASFCGFTPMRTDIDTKKSGGLKWLWEKRALMPLLGLYKGKQGKLPFDYDDVLSLIAPKPCLLVTPKRDRMANFQDIGLCVDSASEAWKKLAFESKLIHLSPDDTNRFQESQQLVFIDWLDGVLGAK